MALAIPLAVWSRRAWLGTTAPGAVLLAVAPMSAVSTVVRSQEHNGTPHKRPAWSALPSSERLPLDPMRDLARTAIDAATTAGASYADAKLTRIVQHGYDCGSQMFNRDVELVGLGVRVLVNGYWGFASSPFWTVDDTVRLAKSAVIQARENARGPTRPVEMGERPPVVTGTWATPVRIDPFTIPIEEKRDFITYWKTVAAQIGLGFDAYGTGSSCTLDFDRQERVVATTDGSLISQTTYETAGHIAMSPLNAQMTGSQAKVSIAQLDRRAVGWELFLDAKIPDQIMGPAREEIQRQNRRRQRSKPVMVGRYTIVCDGATMASLLDTTLGVATQLDRALGYEANAGGTSFLDDPLTMLGAYKVASPLVTVTANRSAPTQLATVKWDDEAVAPSEVTLIKDGVLVDFQTTREQAGWLAPYYQKKGRPVRSNGCAASESALDITLQMVPNLALLPAASGVSVQDMVQAVPDGILIEGGRADCDWQGRSGLLVGTMRQIKRGQLGDTLTHGAIQFDTLDLWKKVAAVGNPSTVGGLDVTQYTRFGRTEKGEPSQVTSHSIRAAAAIIENQPLVDPTRQGHA